MKTIMVLIAMMMLVQAGSIEDFAADHGYETSYAKALAKAKLEKKPLMLVMVTNYCPWCRKYEHNTLNRANVKRMVSFKYVGLILNRQEHKFPDKFDTPRIPTTYFINPNSESVIYSEMGYKTEAEFMEMQSHVKE